MAFKFSLGSVVRSKIDGFEGVVMGRAEYLTGCVKYAVALRALHDGKPIPWEWDDENNLILMAKKFYPFKGSSGGPMQLPPR